MAWALALTALTLAVTSVVVWIAAHRAGRRRERQLAEQRFIEQHRREATRVDVEPTIDHRTVVTQLQAAEFWRQHDEDRRAHAEQAR